jgi:hypothetical protein
MCFKIQNRFLHVFRMILKCFYPAKKWMLEVGVLVVDGT